MIRGPITVFIATITPALVGVFIFGLEVANANRVIRGTTIGSIEAGGTTLDGAQMNLTAAADAFLDTPVVLSDGATFQVQVTPRELGVSEDLGTTFSNAWELGRKGHFVSDISEQIETLLRGKTVNIAVSINPEQFNKKLDHALHPIDRPAQNATFEWSAKKKAFLPIAEHAGTIVDRSAVRAALFEAAQNLQPISSITLRLVEDTPTITSADLPAAQKELDRILARFPITLKAADVSRVVTKDKASSWFVFIERREGDRSWLEISVDEISIQQFLKTEIAPEIDRSPVDAKFHVENGRVIAFSLAQDGRTLDVPASGSAIKSVLTAQQNGAAGPVTLAVSTTPPAIGNDAAEKLQIKELIASAETNFKGSPKNRSWNIKIGAARFNGILIAPGEEFSFVKHLGAIGPETGYKPELVIKQNKTVPEYGGGLCQVSTTMFRAAVNAGLPITERRNHAYVVKYYNPPGFDATIYPPHPDLRFINDTPGHILIQTSVTGTIVRFELYGSSDGRKAEIIGPKTLSRNVDGSAKTTMTVKVTAADGTERSQTFNSTYKSPALYPVDRRNPLE